MSSFKILYFWTLFSFEICVTIEWHIYQIYPENTFFSILEMLYLWIWMYNLIQKYNKYIYFIPYVYFTRIKLRYHSVWNIFCIEIQHFIFICFIIGTPNSYVLNFQLHLREKAQRHLGEKASRRDNRELWRWAGTIKTFIWLML